MADGPQRRCQWCHERTDERVGGQPSHRLCHVNGNVRAVGAAAALLRSLRLDGGSQPARALLGRLSMAGFGRLTIAHAADAAGVQANHPRWHDPSRLGWQALDGAQECHLCGNLTFAAPLGSEVWPAHLSCDVAGGKIHWLPPPRDAVIELGLTDDDWATPPTPSP